MASKSLKDAADSEGAEGESSYEEVGLHSEGQQEKSDSRKLREQGTREDIESTHELVAAYNRADAEEESNALRQWLQRYSKCIDAGFAKHADDGVFEEMSHLAGIQPRCEEDKKLIKKMIFFLGKQIIDNCLDIRTTMAALAGALQRVDERVFDDDPAALLKLSNVLMAELEATQIAFTKTTHNTHSTTLFALHQALLVVHRIMAQFEGVSREQQWFQTFRTKLRNISDCQSHFPTFFQVKIVEQCLERLVIDPASGLRDVPRRMVSILSGCCYLYSGARKAVMADVDLDSIVKGCERFKASVAGQDRHDWYDEFLKLSGAAMLTSESTDFDDDFLLCVQVAMDAQASISKLEDANLLRFGIVNQLSHAVVHGKSPSVRTSAVTELVYVATRHLAYEGWDAEPAIIDAVLATLRDAHSDSSLEEMAETGVLCMESSDSQTVRVRFE